MSLNIFGVQDFSCEIEKPLAYLDHIHEHLSLTANRGKFGRVVLEEEQANTFCWMLVDSMEVIRDLQEALYSDNSKIELVKH